MAKKAKMLAHGTVESYPIYYGEVGNLTSAGTIPASDAVLHLKDYIIINNTILKRSEKGFIPVPNKTITGRVSFNENDSAGTSRKWSNAGGSSNPPYRVCLDDNSNKFVEVYYWSAHTETELLFRCYDIIDDTMVLLNTLNFDKLMPYSHEHLSGVLRAMNGTLYFATTSGLYYSQVSDSGLTTPKKFTYSGTAYYNTTGHYAYILLSDDGLTGYYVLYDSTNKVSRIYSLDLTNKIATLRTDLPTGFPIPSGSVQAFHRLGSEYVHRSAQWWKVNMGTFEFESLGAWGKPYYYDSASKDAPYIPIGYQYNVRDLRTNNLIRGTNRTVAFVNDFIFTKDDTISSSVTAQYVCHHKISIRSDSCTVVYGNEDSEKFLYTCEKKVFITSLLFTSLSDNYIEDSWTDIVSLYVDGVLVMNYDRSETNEFTYANGPLVCEAGTVLDFRAKKIFSDINITIFGVEEDAE